MRIIKKYILLGLLIVYKAIIKVLVSWRVIRFKLLVKLMSLQSQIGEGLFILGKAHLKIEKGGQVFIEKNMQIVGGSGYNLAGVSRPFTLHIYKNAVLRIGNNNGFSGTSICCSKYIEIGNNNNFGGNVCIWDTDFHAFNFEDRRNGLMGPSKEIIIGDDVFIGANTIILKGVTIGNRSIVGAGSIVTKNIPADEIWGGNPARFIRRVIENDRNNEQF
jgi:acetyltransferase-like isoleucine patch superfamily enzyme